MQKIRKLWKSNRKELSLCWRDARCQQAKTKERDSLRDRHLQEMKMELEDKNQNREGVGMKTS